MDEKIKEEILKDYDDYAFIFNDVEDSSEEYNMCYLKGIEDQINFEIRYRAKYSNDKIGRMSLNEILDKITAPIRTNEEVIFEYKTEKPCYISMFDKSDDTHWYKDSDEKWKLAIVVNIKCEY